MKNVFLVYGTIICLLFAYGSFAGWTIADSVKSGKWKPNGHSSYHK